MLSGEEDGVLIIEIGEMSHHLWQLRGHLHNFYYFGIQIGMDPVNHE